MFFNRCFLIGNTNFLSITNSTAVNMLAPVVSTHDVFPQKTFVSVWRQFWLSYLDGGVGATGVYWIEARDVVHHPAMHRLASTPKN